MSAEAIVEIFRTQENRSTYSFVASVTITYFGDTAFIQGLSGTFTTACWRELYAYFKARGVKEAKYYRKDVLKTIIIK